MCGHEAPHEHPAYIQLSNIQQWILDKCGRSQGFQLASPIRHTTPSIALTCSLQASADIHSLSSALSELALVYISLSRMRCNLLLVALLCGLASATARSHRGRTLLQQAPNCARITNCNTCYNARNDDSVTVLLCRVCDTGYRPTAEANECGKLCFCAACLGYPGI